MKRQRSSDPTISRLAENTTQQMCSAQVIPNLWAAVKELVENSLDAKATWVDVSLSEHGTETLEVRDDGDGISHDRMSHFGLLNVTSKISSFDDVQRTRSFGFRGEAVAALCNLCAEVRIVSKQRGCPSSSAEYQTGRLVASSSNLAFEGESGTIVTLTRLFDTIPVRRKHFVNRAKKDLATILLRMQQYCLLPCCKSSVSKVRIRVMHNGAIILAPQVVGRSLDVIASVLGAKVARGMHEFTWDISTGDDNEDSSATFSGVMGLSSSPSHSVQHFFLNGRPVDLPKIQRVIHTAAQEFGSPVYVCELMVVNGQVDINVTPDKRTVILNSEEKICAALFAKAKELFTSQHIKTQQSNAVNSMTTPTKERYNPQPLTSPLKLFGTPTETASSSAPLETNGDIVVDTSSESEEDGLQHVVIPMDPNAAYEPSRDTQSFLTATCQDVCKQEIETLLQSFDFARMEILGQFNMGFIVTRLDGNLYVIDQHAADEKKNFEELMQAAADTITTQPLLVPAQLGPKLAARRADLTAMDVLIRKQGIVLSHDDAGSKIVAIPVALGILYKLGEVEDLLLSMCESPSSGDTVALPWSVRHALATRACRKSIMIGTALDRRVMVSVVHQLATLEQPWNCPHGRPTVRRITSLH